MKINQLMLTAALAVCVLPATAENTAANTVTNAVGTAADNLFTTGKVVLDKAVNAVTQRGAGAVNDPRDRGESGLTPDQNARVLAANPAAANTTAADLAAAYAKIANAGMQYGAGIASTPGNVATVAKQRAIASTHGHAAKKHAVRHVSHAKGKKHRAHDVRWVQHRPEVSRVSTVPQVAQPLQPVLPSESRQEVTKPVDGLPVQAPTLVSPIGNRQYYEPELYHGA